MAEMEQKRAERRFKIEEENTKLEQLQAEKEVQVVVIQVRAYECSVSDYEGGVDLQTNTAQQETESTAQHQSKRPRD